jgi:hypothetical protein
VQDPQLIIMQIVLLANLVKAKDTLPLQFTLLQDVRKKQLQFQYIRRVTTLISNILERLAEQQNNCITLILNHMTMLKTVLKISSQDQYKHLQISCGKPPNKLDLLSMVKPPSWLIAILESLIELAMIAQQLANQLLKHVLRLDVQQLLHYVM